MNEINGGISKPFYRIYRAKQRNDGYILDPRYANNRHSLRRAYKLIEDDLIKLFEYVEPTDKNIGVFSLRSYELLLRAATEFETNCKQILIANGCRPNGKNWNIEDYRKIDRATKLSEYKVKLDIWFPEGRIFQSLAPWKSASSLKWYDDYNKVKHNRAELFEKATLLNVIEAVSAVWIILYAQFSSYVFDPHHDAEGYTHDDDTGFEYSENTLFSIKPFDAWQDKDAYIFDWPILDENPFQRFLF